MLLLDNPLEIEGLTLFRDHVAPKRFHYLPSAPALVSRNGRAGLELLRYRGGAEGGVLTLDIELALDDATHERVHAALRALAGESAELVPVLFDEGTVRLIALDVASARPPDAAGPADAAGDSFLIERVLGSATPSLLGRLRSIFSIELSREGAVLVANALAGDALPLLVVYELAFSGLLPARGVRANVNTRAAYDYLRTRFAPGTLLFRGDLDGEAESMLRAGHIDIEDVDYRGVEAAERAERHEQIRETLDDLTETLFFRPAASPHSLDAAWLMKSPGVRGAWAQAGQAQAAFVLRSLQQVEEQVISYDLSVTSVVRRRVAPQSVVRLPSASDPADHVRDVTLDWPPAEVEIRAIGGADADWTGVDAVQVDVRSGTQERSLLVSPGDPDRSVTLPRGDIEYRLLPLLRQDASALGEPPVANADFAPLAGHTVLAAPDALTERRVVRVGLGVVDPARVTRVSGAVVVGERRRDFLLDRDTPEISVTVWGRQEVRVEAELHLADGRAVRLEQAVDAQEQTVLIHQPPTLFRNVVVELRDPLRRYETVFVEVESADAGSRGHLELSADHPTGYWSHARSDGDDSGYRFRVRKVGRNAQVTESDWVPSVDSLLLVGDLDVRVDTIQGVLLGGAHPQGTLLTLTSLEPPENVSGRRELFCGPGETSFRASLPFRRDAERRYLVEGQVFFDSGFATIEAREESGEVLLLEIAPP